MKLLSYNYSSSMSSASSSSCTSSSFYAKNICSSKGASAGGCLGGILRRMLCSRSLPTHPTSDHDITEASFSIGCDKNQELESKEKVVVPSVVARLMGLESMPSMSTSSTTPCSITRSRSMNAVDCKGNGCGGDDHVNDGHRRVKSTLSFREMPTFLELENEEFFVLSFESGSETKEKRLKEKKCEMGNGELRQRGGGKGKSKESEAKVTEKKKKQKEPSRRASDHKAAYQGVGISSVKFDNSTTTYNEELPCVGLEFVECSTPKGHKEVSDGAKLSKNKKKTKVKILEHECSSEESSPVSVLDFDQFIIDHEVPTSELGSDLVQPNSRRKLSPEPENFECQSRHRRRKDSNLISPYEHKTKKTDGTCVGSRKKHCNNQNFLDMCDQICKMTEAEQAESNWLHMLKHGDFEDICADFESQILDQSLGELVHELTGLAVKN